jgi:Coenzyme PQQ synthesis protein D (PqqD)
VRSGGVSPGYELPCEHPGAFTVFRAHGGALRAFPGASLLVRVRIPLSNTALMLLPVPHPDVIARALPDGSVLFHPLTEVYFGLNETGTVVWSALAQGASTEEALVAAVLARWPDAPVSDVTCHVRELLADLSIEGLVVDTADTLG